MTPSRIAELLPDVIRRTAGPGSPLDDILGVMAALHEPVERVVDDFGRYVDPYRCPERFVPYLAAWVGLEWLAGTDTDATPVTGDGPLRHLVAEAAELARRRGTEIGLMRMLELGTGIDGYAVASDPGRPYHLIVTGPQAARHRRALVLWIIRHEKPAFVTADLALGDEEPTPVEPPTAPAPVRPEPLGEVAGG